MRNVAFLVVGLALLVLQSNVFRVIDGVRPSLAALVWVVALVADVARTVRPMRGFQASVPLSTFRPDWSLPASVLLGYALLAGVAHVHVGRPIPALVLPLILFMGVHEYSFARGAIVAFVLGYATDVLGIAPVGLYTFTYVATFVLARAAGVRPQQQNALSFIESTGGRAWLCTTFDPFQLNSPDFSRNAIDGLNQDFANGAVAAKIWKNVGMEIKNASGQYVMLDDPRFEPIYRDIAAQKKTLIIHAADPDSAWTAQYLTTASASYYAANPEWDMSKRPDAPRKQTILDARDHVLALNPDLRVIGAHLGSMENDLNGLGERLDRYPNFAVDVAARVARLTREPREQVRAFFLKYQDRILYGTDLSFDPQTRHKELSPEIWELRYADDWRYFSTGDVFQYGDHQVQGLDLPRAVLKKLYHDNAVRWIPGIDTSSR